MKTLLKTFSAAALAIALTAVTASCNKEVTPGQNTPGQDTPGQDTPGQDTPGTNPSQPGEYQIPLPELDLIPNPANPDDFIAPKPDDTVNPNFLPLDDYTLEAIDTTKRTASIRFTGAVPEIKDGITILNPVNREGTNAWIIKPYAHTVEGKLLKISSWVNVPLNELLYNQTIYLTADEAEGNCFAGSETGSKKVVNFCPAATKAEDKKVGAEGTEKVSKWGVDISCRINFESSFDMVLKFSEPKIDPNSIRAISKLEKAGISFNPKATAELTASVTFTKGATRTWDPELKRSLVEKVFLIPTGPMMLPVGVGLDIRGFLELNCQLEGTVSATIPVSVSGRFGLEFNRGDGISPIAEINPEFLPEPPTFAAESQGTASVKGSVYPRLKVCPGVFLELFADPMPYLKPTASAALKKVLFASFDLMAGFDLRAGVAFFDPLDRGRAPYKTLVDTGFQPITEKRIWGLPEYHKPVEETQSTIYMMPNDPLEITYDYFEYNAVTGEYVRSKNFMPYEAEVQVNVAEGGTKGTTASGIRAGGGYCTNTIDQGKADYFGQGKSKYLLKSTSEDVLLITRTLNGDLDEHQADTIRPVRRIKSFRAVYTYTGSQCIKSRTYVKEGKYIRDDYINHNNVYGTSIYDYATGTTWMWNHDPLNSPVEVCETVPTNGCAHYRAIEGFEGIIDGYEDMYLKFEGLPYASVLPPLEREWRLGHYYCKRMNNSGTILSWWMNIPFYSSGDGTTYTLSEFEIYKKAEDCSDEIFAHVPAGNNW